MIFRMNHQTTIDDLRRHPADLVRELEQLLAAGAEAYPDPHRKDFYEVENTDHVFYIHVRPHGRVWLLAIWPKIGTPLAAEPATADSCALSC
jgi:hypothetical protein